MELWNDGVMDYGVWECSPRIIPLFHHSSFLYSRGRSFQSRIEKVAPKGAAAGERYHPAGMATLNR